MVIIYRIIFFLLISINTAQAEDFAASTSYTMDIFDRPTADTPANLCSQLNGKLDGRGNTLINATVQSANRCSYQFIEDGSTYSSSVGFYQINICPTGSQDLGNGQCRITCAPPTTYNSITHQCSTQCIEGEQSDVGNYTNPRSLECDNGCQSNFIQQGVVYCNQSGNSAQGIYTVFECKKGYFQQTGANCSGDYPAASQPEPTQPDDAEHKCLSSGSSFGTVNGVTVCLPQGTAGSKPLTIKSSKDTVSSNSDNTTTSTKSTTQNADGTVTTQTTTNVTNNSTGVTTSTTGDKKTEPKTTFCEDNPNSTICKTSSFGGSCAAFTCDGDAIQCAIAKEQHNRNCTLFDKPTSESDLGKEIQMNDGNNPAKESNREVIQLSNSLNEGNNIGGGSFQDLHIQLPGGGFDLPFSKLNFLMNLLGGFLLAGAYLNAARIVGVR